MTRALVVGATGYTGREVVRALRDRGVEVVAHARPGSSALAGAEPTFRAVGATVDTTAWESAAIRSMLERHRPDLVFALLGTTKARARAAAKAGRSPATESYEAVDYALTSMLIRAVVEAGLRPRFVYLSSAGVREGTRNAYLAVRARIERELRESGLPFTIARPSFITGPDREDRRPGERMGAAAADVALALAGVLGARRLRDRYRSTDAKTLARSLVRQALDPASEGRILESEALRG
jgi:nucleoside-diphosphate-sugar epimerase